MVMGTAEIAIFRLAITVPCHAQIARLMKIKASARPGWIGRTWIVFLASFDIDNHY
jgi:hypothetical protein